MYYALRSEDLWYRVLDLKDPNAGVFSSKAERDVFTYKATHSIRVVAGAGMQWEKVKIRGGLYARVVSTDFGLLVATMRRYPYNYIRVEYDNEAAAYHPMTKLGDVKSWVEWHLKRVPYLLQHMNITVHRAVYEDEIREEPDYVVRVGEYGGVNIEGV